MGRKDVGRALEAMQDRAVRERLAHGDFEAVEPRLNLTEDERKLVSAAATDYPTGGLDDWTDSPDRLVNSFTGAAYYSIGGLASARLALT